MSLTQSSLSSHYRNGARLTKNSIGFNLDAPVYLYALITGGNTEVQKGIEGYAGDWTQVNLGHGVSLLLFK